jgi:hypothetical protein
VALPIPLLAPDTRATFGMANAGMSIPVIGVRF